MKGKEIPNYVVVVRADGHITPKPIDLDNELEELQNLVGGWIETFTLDDEWMLIVDEEGRCKGKQSNQYASTITSFMGRFTPVAGDAILVRYSGYNIEFLTFDEASLISGNKGVI